VRDLLTEISRDRARLGFTPSESATFVFSLKHPLFAQLRVEPGDSLATETWSVSLLLDALGLLTVEAYQKSREEVIARQQEELLELSTPVVQLWDGVLALPLIGTLDSARHAARDPTPQPCPWYRPRSAARPPPCRAARRQPARREHTWGGLDVLRAHPARVSGP